MKDLYKVIGLSIQKTTDGAYTDGGYSEAEVIGGVLYLEKDKQMFQMTYQEWYGSCGSGYTTATGGYWGKIEPAKMPMLFQYIPKYKHLVYVEVSHSSENEICKVIDSEDGLTILSIDENGGDSYYPSGGVHIDLNFFQPLKRAKYKQQKYLFWGQSGIGKSFIASNLQNLKVYETDSNKELPESLSTYDVVVVGNKYKFTKEEILNKFKDFEVDIVNVNFSYE